MSSRKLSWASSQMRSAWTLVYADLSLEPSRSYCPPMPSHLPLIDYTFVSSSRHLEFVWATREDVTRSVGQTDVARLAMLWIRKNAQLAPEIFYDTL